MELVSIEEREMTLGECSCYCVCYCSCSDPDVMASTRDSIWMNVGLNVLDMMNG